jgi:hypothetical protein
MNSTTEVEVLATGAGDILERKEKEEVMSEKLRFFGVSFFDL